MTAPAGRATPSQTVSWGRALTDIFISYAHEDQSFVRGMVPALEAEGFSVWWDHTIPPGKSWDSFIAKGIAEARCCVVVWSAHSVDSDWVKEEATLAKDGHKFLPVQIDGALPPVGFRRIQAANLQNWTGDRNNPQFQLLVREARTLLQGDAPPRAAAPPLRPAYEPPPAPPAPRKPPPWPLIGAAAATAGVALIALMLFMRAPEPAQDASLPATEMATEAAPDAASDEGLIEAAPGVDPREMERLRRERDQAVESARSQQEENERLRRERAAQQAAANTQVAQSTQAPSGATAGVFSMSNTVCVGPRSWDGGVDGTYIFDAAGTISGAGWWRQSGDRITGDTGSLRIDGRLVGSRLTGTANWSSSSQYAGTFDLACEAR